MASVKYLYICLDQRMMSLMSDLTLDKAEWILSHALTFVPFIEERKWLEIGNIKMKIGWNDHWHFWSMVTGKITLISKRRGDIIVMYERRYYFSSLFFYFLLLSGIFSLVFELISNEQTRSEGLLDLGL